MSNGTEPWEFGNTGGAGEPDPFLTEEEDNIPCQEEKRHFTFPDYATGPITTVVFDKQLAPDQDAWPPLTSFEQELKHLLNKYSMENDSNTPDFILAEYMHTCLTSFNLATRAREHWYGRRVF